MAKRFIISEEERSDIRSRYGLINEQSEDAYKAIKGVQCFLNKKGFKVQITGVINSETKKAIQNWILRCKKYKKDYPKIEKCHEDKNGYINSYRFIDKLCDELSENNIITADMGTALLSGHQAFKIKRNQRFMTSTGLGEMGFGLPAALGACFAHNKREIINGIAEIFKLAIIKSSELFRLLEKNYSQLKGLI